MGEEVVAWLDQLGGYCSDPSGRSVGLNQRVTVQVLRCCQFGKCDGMHADGREWGCEGHLLVSAMTELWRTARSSSPPII